MVGRIVNRGVVHVQRLRVVTARNVQRIGERHRALRNPNGNNISCERIVAQLAQETVVSVAGVEDARTLALDIRMGENVFGDNEILWLLDNALVVKCIMANVDLVDDVVREHKIVVAVCRESGVETSLHQDSARHIVRLEGPQEQNRPFSVRAHASWRVSLCNRGTIGITHSLKVVGVHRVNVDIARIVGTDIVLVREDKVLANLALADEHVAGLANKVNIERARLVHLGTTERQQVVGSLLEVGGRAVALAVEFDFGRRYHGDIDGHLAGQNPYVRRDALVLHLVLELGIQKVHAALLLLDHGPTAALLAQQLARTANRSTVLAVPLLVVVLARQQGVNDAVVRRLVDRVDNLAQVHEVMLTSLVSLIKTVFDNKREATSDKPIRTRLPFGRDIPGHSLVRFQVHQGLVEAEDIPLDRQVVGQHPWQDHRSVPRILLGNQIIQDGFEMLVLAFVRLGQVVGLVGEFVLGHHFLVLRFDGAEKGLKRVVGGSGSDRVKSSGIFVGHILIDKNGGLI